MYAARRWAVRRAGLLENFYNRLFEPVMVWLHPLWQWLGYQPLRLAKKIAAGAQFFQTQYCYDLPLFKRFMARVRELGLHKHCFILAGVAPLASAKAARWIREHVPGVHIPDAVIDRVARAQNQKQEGKQLCIELIQQVREIEGVSGVHVMAYRQEETVAEIIDASGVLEGRIPWYPERDK